MPCFYWFAGEHFPLIRTMGTGWCNPLNTPGAIPLKPDLRFNPADYWLRVACKEGRSQYMVLNAQGKAVLQGLQNSVQPGIYVGHLSGWAYVLRLVSSQGDKPGAGRFVKH
jgi:hypothetical protein